jgi:hypothetical protein
VVASPHPTQTAASTVTAAATSTAKKPNCDPPWIIDDKGHRQYKRECL